MTLSQRHRITFIVSWQNDVNDKIVSIWKEAVVAYFKVLLDYVGEIEEKHEESRQRLRTEP
jgi:hypothetical protein